MKLFVTMFIACMLASGCASTGMHFVECDREIHCEQRAKLTCNTDNYRVHTKIDRTIVRERQNFPGGAASVGDVAGGFGGVGGGDGMIDREPPKRFKWEVECNPAAPDAAGVIVEIETMRLVPTEMTPEQRAELALHKARYMREVCALKHADIREQEIELARQYYDDPSLSCPSR